MKDKQTTNIKQGLIPIERDQNRGIIYKTNEENKAENSNQGFWVAVCERMNKPVYV